jgi:hypothetical protein
MTDQDRQSVIQQLLGRERLTGDYEVLLTSAAKEKVERAQQAVLDAESLHEAKATADTETALAEANAALVAVWKQVQGSVVKLSFEGLPDDLFDELVGKYPATDEQEKERGAGLRWNPQTFPPALIAATCTFPGFVSADEAHEVFYGPKSRFSRTEAASVFATALLTCEGSREVADWGKGSGETAV